MTDKPMGAENPAPRLPNYRILALQGADALRFAQSQFMNDVLQLADGQWQWNGWLNAKGRLIALFALLRLDGQTLWLLLPDAEPAQLAEALRRYVLRSKVKLEPRPDLQVALLSDAELPPGEVRALGEACWQVGGVLGHSLVIAAQAGSDDAAALARWQMHELRTGLPRLDATQSEKWTPQQLSLARLAAYSVKKGCYPGQEVVARTHFLGQAKRGLVLLQGAARSGDAIWQNGHEIGQVIAHAGELALAVLPLQRDAAALMAGDHVLVPIPFADTQS